MAKLEEVARKVAEEAKQDKPTKVQFVRSVYSTSVSYLLVLYTPVDKVRLLVVDKLIT